VQKEGHLIMQATETRVMHVRFAGRSEDLDLVELKLWPEATDESIRSTLATRYDCTAADLKDYVIVREPQAIIVRPKAIYG
jgi:hypothetical protein